jgi:hypothetical protein
MPDRLYSLRSPGPADPGRVGVLSAKDGRRPPTPPNEIGTYDGFLAVTFQELESIITPFER